MNNQEHEAIEKMSEFNDVKLRAWDKVNKEMITVECVDFSGKEIQRGTPTMVAHAGDGCHALKDVILLRYSGLHDKNNVEICQGHRVRYNITRYDGDHEYEDIVIYWKGSLWLGWTILCEVIMNDPEAEIVGDMHDESELEVSEVEDDNKREKSDKTEE